MDSAGLKIELIDVDPCVRKICVEAPLERVEEEKLALFRELEKTVTIPGFRKGHVPRRIIEKMYSSAALGDVTRKIIQSAYKEAVELNNLQPAGEPLVDDIKAEEGEPISFSATVEIFPDIQIKDISGWTLTRRIRKSTQKDVDRILERYQESHARFEPVDRDDVREGDYPLIDYSAVREDGVPLESFSGQNKQIQVVRNEMLDAFHSGIIGMKKGEEKEFDAVLPKEFPIPDMADSTIKFKVKVHEIKQKIIPDLDDQLASEVSDFDTVGELRSDILSRLEANHLELAKNNLQRELTDKLVEENQFELPPKTVARQATELSERVERDMRAQGLKFGDGGADPEKIYREQKNKAERLLREELIFAAFAKSENIELDQKDVDDQLVKLARSLNQSAEKTMEQLMESKQGIDAITHQAFTGKTINAMLGKVTVKDEFIEDKIEETDDK